MPYFFMIYKKNKSNADSIVITTVATATTPAVVYIAFINFAIFNCL